MDHKELSEILQKMLDTTRLLSQITTIASLCGSRNTLTLFSLS